MHVVLWRGPDGAAAPPLVLLHGFMGSSDAWGDLPRRLAVDRTVVVPDLLGHGESHAPRTPGAYAIPRLAAAVSAAVRAVVSAVAPGPADWLGYSMGGRVLLSAVCDGLVSARRVLVESSSPGIEDGAARDERLAVDAARAHTLETEGLEAFVNRWMAMPLFASQQRLAPEVLEAERRRRCVHDPVALAACLVGASVARQPSYWDHLDPLGARLLVLTGGLDHRFAAIGHAMVARCPRARRYSVPDAGHAVHLEAPDAWLRAVREHLESTDGTDMTDGRA